MSDLTARVGDKVKLKHSQGMSPGARGRVVSVQGTALVVCVDGSESTVTLSEDQLTNFSLAARKAWRNMPARNVGRPKGSRVCDRLSVTIRLDRDLWERFRKAEAAGIVADRTSVLNQWIADGLSTLAAPPHRKAS